jgi:hypothetical protein
VVNAKVREGRLLESTDDVEVSGLSHWRAPFTSGFKGRLPKGVVVSVSDVPLAGAAVVACRPRDYEAVQRLVIDEDDWKSAKYDGYTLLIPIVDVGTLWRQIS